MAQEWTQADKGRKGGLSASPAKRRSSRENGKKGGRYPVPGVARQVRVRLPVEVWQLINDEVDGPGGVIRHIILDAHKSGWFGGKNV